MTAHTLFGKFTLRAALALLACLLIGPGPLAHAQAAPDDAPNETGRTVLITGANRGIGLELARQYSAAGWRNGRGVCVFLVKKLKCLLIWWFSPQGWSRTVYPGS
mgnify:CR=1 FL=1